MTSDTQVILAAMRAQAWERAIGELKSMLVTFYGEKERFETFQIITGLFIADVENKGLNE